MLIQRCQTLATRQQLWLPFSQGLSLNISGVGPLTLGRGKHVQTTSKVKAEKGVETAAARRKKTVKTQAVHENNNVDVLVPTAGTATSAFDLKLSDLQELARTLGISQTAPKPALVARLGDTLRHHHPLPPDARILSIDLGIRNLAYALLTPAAPRNMPKPTVHAWNRVDLRSLSATTATHDSPLTQDFSPPSLSSVALSLVQSHLLPLKPTHILIEKQRFRSGGGSAVLEWTVRVNSLESMLYAILATLKSLGHWDGVVIPIDPRRVGPFLLENEGLDGDWARKQAVEKKKKTGVLSAKGSKENKKLKIALVGSWLRDGRGVVFDGESEVMRNAFLGRWLPKERKSRAKKAEVKTEVNTEEEKGIEKLDDVADCLLQGVAWLRWEEDKKELLKELGKGL